MLMVVKNLKLIFSYFKLNIQKELQYKTSFILKVFMMVLNDAFFLLQWVIIFSIVDNIAGYEFNDVLLLWGLSAGSYGLAHALFGNAFNLNDMIYEGKLDIYLTQPKNILINVCASSGSISALGDLLYCFIVLFIIGAPWWWFLVVIPVIVIGSIIYVCCIITLQSLSFYIKRGGAIADMVSSAVTLFGTYPGPIFKGIAKVVLYTIIPVGFMIFTPVENLFMSFNIYWILAMVGIAAFWALLAIVSFNKGLKRYNSGNLMGGRL